MKKLLFILIAFNTAVFAQTLNSTSLLKLQNDLNSTSYNNSISQNVINDIPGKKSGGLALFYSLLLPGMGELYAGNYSSGKYFTIAEGVIWGFYAGFNIYGNWQKENYKDFARSFGGINSEGKNDAYYSTIGDYLDVEEYNKVQSLDREFSMMYDKDKYYWKWTDHSQRREYRNMWVSSEQAYNNVRFAVGAMIVNRIMSAINAVRLVSRHNKNLKTETGWNVSVSAGNPYSNSSDGLSLNFSTSF